VIIHDFCYHVFYRDLVRQYFNPEERIIEEEETFNVGYWILMYSLIILFHTFNTAVVYQRWIGVRIK